MSSELRILEDDILRYSQPGPRYTSYPSANNWTERFSQADFRRALERGSDAPGLSLYFHIPFCEKLCHFCACNRVIDRSHSKESEYIQVLKSEIELVTRLLGISGPVMQLHWGGGTPTYLAPDRIEELSEFIFKKFKIHSHAEISVEVNPVVTTAAHLDRLRACGFERLSMGVQDFDPEVQDVINRHQTYEQTRDLVHYARDLGFSSINLDLIYGLPKQTSERFMRTLELVLSLKPDRLAVYSFAKVPWKQPFQRRFADSDLPEGLEKVGLYLMARQYLLSRGYEAIGMDHFALPQDELAIASRSKTLHRNFMGYTTKPQLDMLGFGTSAISSFGSVYSQNDKALPGYQKRIQEGILATRLGHQMSRDDLIRRDLILALMCNFEVLTSDLEKKFEIDFQQYFINELKALRDFESQKMVEFKPHGFTVVGRGQVLVRNIAMIFDPYLAQDVAARKFSGTI